VGALMTALEKLQKWLKTYPAWEDTLLVDFTEATPGNAGLFPKGLEEIGRREDVLGNLQIVCRYRFDLYRRTAGRNNAQWLLDFQDWVQQQSADGQAPYFGDVPGEERLRAEKGTLKEGGQEVTYLVTLTAEFVRAYAAK